MHTYREFQKVAWRELPTGQSVSLPVPIPHNESLLDTVFTYPGNHKTHEVGAPLLVIEADLDRGIATATSATEIFSDVHFQAMPFKTLALYKERASEAKALYAEAREEVARGKIGPASKRYAELVWSVTQKPLQPYYQALSPTLFADCL